MEKKEKADIPVLQEEVLYVKNMVCNRCIRVVREQLEGIGLSPLAVELGIVRLSVPVTPDVWQRVKVVLEPWGFELLDDKRGQLTEQIKRCIIEWVYRQEENPRENLSVYLSSRLGRDYSMLSKLFSGMTHTTIEKYFIAQKIERAKELLVYDELSLNEIADRLHYSSVAHLSSQFKSVTGLTPGHFRQVKEQKRKPLDEI